MSQPDKITKTILTTRNMYVRMTISTDNKKWFSDYSKNDVVTRNINVNALINIGMISKNTTGWDKSQSVMIHCKNHHVILRQMKRFIDSLYKGEMFGKDSNDKIIIYSDIAQQNTELIKLPYTDNNALLLRPYVITDSNNITYEGAMICFNKQENYIEVYIDELEALYYTLSKVDFFTYSQALLNSISLGEVNCEDNTTYNKNLNW